MIPHEKIHTSKEDRELSAREQIEETVDRNPSYKPSIHDQSWHMCVQERKWPQSTVCCPLSPRKLSKNASNVWKAGRRPRCKARIRGFSSNDDGASARFLRNHFGLRGISGFLGKMEGDQGDDARRADCSLDNPQGRHGPTLVGVVLLWWVRSLRFD